MTALGSNTEMYRDYYIVFQEDDDGGWEYHIYDKDRQYITTRYTEKAARGWIHYLTMGD